MQSAPSGSSTPRTGTGVLVPSRLPHFLTTFIDRQAELRSLKTLLHSSRMVTLMGTGGVGKSRLAVEVAKSSQDAWPDGTWWVELVGTDDVTGLLVAMFELPGQGPPLRVVSSWLAGKRVLLILDNCEHVAAECATVCRGLLEDCPELTILATSREPLGVPGEVRWPLGALGDAEALQLFQARARLVQPDFDARPQAETVTEICVRLDQLPLAIEMAAARLDMMSAGELLANLSDRFRVLASDARTVHERQQTMTATIDWSHRLLTPAEAQMFRRLGVFQGGFSLDAAWAVCSEMNQGEVLGVLTRLVQKSMVVAETSEAGTRFRLLESHREYAFQKLLASGDLDSVSRRHYEFYKTWLEPNIKPAAKTRESANLWAAIAWARENADDKGLELAIEVADFEYSNHARTRTLLLDLLDRSQVKGAARARALNLAARLALRQADHLESRRLADASVAAARRLKDPLLIAQTLSGAGVVYHAANQLTAARKMYDEALSLLKDSGNRRLAIETQNQVSVLATEQGHHQEALAMLEECIAFSRSEGDDATTARYLESDANARLGVGDVEGASRSWHEALTTFRQLNDPFGAIWCVGGLALTSVARGDPERALRLGAVVDRMSREWSLSAWPARLGQLEEARGKARTQLTQGKADRAWNEGLSMSADRALAYALEEDAPASVAEAGPLSRREREVVAMVAAGFTNKQIAERLFIAERTAEGHVERIRNKLGVRSRTEVATWALAHGIVPGDLDKR